MASMDDPKNARSPDAHPVSCTECQRRKQKCSRQWPCNHCHSRKVPHLCQFTSKKSVNGEMNSRGTHMKKRKEGALDHAVDVTDESLSSDLSAADALKALGYFQIDGDPKFSGFWSLYTDPTCSRGVEEACRSIAPKLYCDALVQNFLDDANYQYYMLYPPGFLEEYNRWWEARSKRQNVCPAFTCLILRVCANSALFLRPGFRDRFELELGESAQGLTERYHRAAEKLTDQIPPGAGGLVQVQQLFLAAFWFKCESRFIDSWHALAKAIRQAQEIGMHDESLVEGMSEFELEMRRRVWCVLFTWDRFMGLILSRPLILDDRACHVKLPQANLENGSTNPDLPSPIMHIALQQRLIMDVIDLFRAPGYQLSTNEALSLSKSVKDWFGNLPPIFRENNPDTQYDNTHRYLILQRLQIWSIGYDTIVSALKPYLTRSYVSTSPHDKLEQQLQTIAVEYALRLMNVSQKLFDLLIPDSAKYFLVVFLPFDIAALLCSAVLHDQDSKSLPRRPDILRSIGIGLSLINKLKRVTKTGPIAWNVLSSLIPSLHLTEDEMSLVDPESIFFSNHKRPAKRPAVSRLEELTPPSSLTPPEEARSTLEAVSVSAEPTPPYEWKFNPSQSLGLTPLPDIDFGVLEPLWDWGNINLSFTEPLVMSTEEHLDFVIP